MRDESPETSDQLPEEAPPEQVPDDDGKSEDQEGNASRDADRKGTGNPEDAA